jgi:hypothetical protein
MRTIEAILASPPDHDELVVQFFHRDGAQFGELFRHGEHLVLEVFAPPGDALRLDAREFAEVLSGALATLTARLQSR